MSRLESIEIVLWVLDPITGPYDTALDLLVGRGGDTPSHFLPIDAFGSPSRRLTPNPGEAIGGKLKALRSIKSNEVAVDTLIRAASVPEREFLISRRNTFTLMLSLLLQRFQAAH